MERLGAELVKLDDWGVRKLRTRSRVKTKALYSSSHMDEGAVGARQVLPDNGPILRHVLVTDEKARAWKRLTGDLRRAGVVRVREQSLSRAAWEQSPRFIPQRQKILMFPCRDEGISH